MLKCSDITARRKTSESYVLAIVRVSTTGNDANKYKNVIPNGLYSTLIFFRIERSNKNAPIKETKESICAAIMEESPVNDASIFTSIKELGGW